MIPQVKRLNISDSVNDILSFELSNVNTSIANSLRRTLLSDISILVFKTAPYDANLCEITKNTSNLNNEIIKQRMGCIPIHVEDIQDFDLENNLLEVNVQNTSDVIKFVTTNDFKIKNTKTNTYMSSEKVNQIFPPNSYTGQYIDLVRLKPKMSELMPGEQLRLTCKFSISNAKDDGMYNVVSNCSYGCTVDKDEQEKKLQIQKQKWKDEGKTSSEINFESKNWMLLEGLRVIKKDSFDFSIETVGIYDNKTLILKACDILINKFAALDETTETDRLQVEASNNTMKNCYDVTLENEDYTVGKVIEYLLYINYYEKQIATFCGFKKMHPHDTDSIIRIAYKSATDKTIINNHISLCCKEAIEIYKKIKTYF